MARRRNRLLDYLVYLLVRTVAMWAHMFPIRHSYRVARAAGDLAWRFARRHRRTALGHLRLSFPDWPEDRIEAVARESFRHLMYLGVEVLFTPRLITPERWNRHLRLVNLAPTLRLLVAQERGVILLTGHFGNWEVVGYMMATLGFPSVSVARPLDNPYLNAYIMDVRERTGQSILYKSGAAAGMSDVLERRGALAFVADQDAGSRGVFVDFFGRPASTFRSIALMALRYEVPIVVGYGRRVGMDYAFEVGVERVILPGDWAGQEDPVRWITQEFTRELERVVRRSPEQYLWAHRRWKHRPDGTKVGGDGVA